MRGNLRVSVRAGSEWAGFTGATRFLPLMNRQKLLSEQ